MTGAAHRHHRQMPARGPALSVLRMGVAERLAIAALGCAVLWSGMFWALG